jgi:hypothetical protein
VEPRDPDRREDGKGGFPPYDDPTDFRQWRERDWDQRFRGK